MEFHSTTEKNKQSKIEKSWLTTNTWKTEKKKKSSNRYYEYSAERENSKKRNQSYSPIHKTNLNNNKLINN